MTVSIIMPVFNGGRTISRSIESVKSQTYTDWELLVVDDGSTDNSLAIARDFQSSDSRIKVIHLDRNGGQSHARNVGIEASRGDWVTVLDADDIYKKNRLDVLVSFLEWNKLDMAADNISFYDVGIEKEVAVGISCKKLNIHWSLKNQLANDLLHKNFKWGLLQPIIRKSFLDETGILYNEKFNMAEDSLFLLELLSFNPRSMICNMPMYVYSTAVGQISGVASTTTTSNYKVEDHLAVINYFIVSYSSKLSLKENRLANNIKVNINDFTQYMHLKDTLKNKGYAKALTIVATNPKVVRFINKAITKKICALSNGFYINK